MIEGRPKILGLGPELISDRADPVVFPPMSLALGPEPVAFTAESLDGNTLLACILKLLFEDRELGAVRRCTMIGRSAQLLDMCAKLIALALEPVLRIAQGNIALGHRGL